MVRSMKWLRGIGGVVAVSAVAALAGASPAAAQIGDCQQIGQSAAQGAATLCYGVSNHDVDGHLIACVSLASRVTSLDACVKPAAPSDQVMFFGDCDTSLSSSVCTTPGPDLCVRIQPILLPERDVCVDGVEANAEFALTLAHGVAARIQTELANAPEAVRRAVYDANDAVMDVAGPVATQVLALVNKAIADAVAALDGEVCTPNVGPPPICVSSGG